MNAEVWDIIDENGYPTGKTTLRGHCILKSGEYHLVVHIWIVSSKGDFIIQRRSDNKKLMPGEWAATGGAAISGEDSFKAARRELYEELGILSNTDSLKKIARIKKRNSILDIWMTICDIPASQLILQRSEVAEVRSIPMSELLEMINHGNFHNYGKEYFEKTFEGINELRGAVL